MKFCIAVTLLLPMQFCASSNSGCGCPCTDNEPGVVMKIETSPQEGVCGRFISKTEPCPGHLNDYCLSSGKCCNDCKIWEPRVPGESTPCAKCAASGGKPYVNSKGEFCCSGENDPCKKA